MEQKNVLEIGQLQIAVELQSLTPSEERARRYHEQEGEEHEEIRNVPFCETCDRRLELSEIFREVSGTRTVEPDAVKEGFRTKRHFRAVGWMRRVRLDVGSYKDHYVVLPDPDYPVAEEALAALYRVLQNGNRLLVCTLGFRDKDPARRVLLEPAAYGLVAHRLNYRWEFVQIQTSIPKRGQGLGRVPEGRAAVEQMRTFLRDVPQFQSFSVLDDLSAKELAGIEPPVKIGARK